MKKNLLCSGILLIILLNYNATAMENENPFQCKNDSKKNNTDGKKEIFKIENEISKIEDDETNNKYEVRKSIAWLRHITNTDGKKEIFKIENEISKIEDDETNNKYEEIDFTDSPKKMKDKKLQSDEYNPQNQNGSTYYNFNVEPEFEMKFGQSTNKSRWLEKLYSYKDLTFHPKNTNNEIKIQFLNENGDQNSAVVKRKCMKKTITVSIILSIIFAIFMLMFHNNLLSLK